MAAALERRREPERRRSRRRARARRCGRPSRGRWRRCARATGAPCRGRCRARRGRRESCWPQSARPARCRRGRCRDRRGPPTTARADGGADRRVVDRRLAVRCRGRRRRARAAAAAASRCSFSGKPAWSAPIAMRIRELYPVPVHQVHRVHPGGGRRAHQVTGTGAAGASGRRCGRPSVAPGVFRTGGRRSNPQAPMRQVTGQRPQEPDTMHPTHLMNPMTPGAPPTGAPDAPAHRRPGAPAHLMHPTHPVVMCLPRGEERVRRGHPWIYRADCRPARAEAGDIGDGARAARPPARRRAVQRSIADHAAHADARRPDGGRGALARAARSRRSRFRERLGIDAHGVPPGARRSRSAAVAHRRSLRRLPRAAGAVAGHGSAAARDHGAAGRARWRRRASSRATIRACACSKGLEQNVEVLHGEVPADHRGHRGRRPRTTSIPGTGQKTGLFLDQRENREAAARYARGRVLDSFSYNGGFALRARAGMPTRSWRSTSRPTRWRASRANAAPNGARQRDRARGQRVRRAARPRAQRRAVRHDRARPAGVRQEQGVGAEGDRRLQGNQPARAAAAASPAARSSPAAARTTSTRRCSPRSLYEAAVDAHAPVTVVEKRMQGRDHPGAARRAGDLLPEVRDPERIE